MIGVATATSIDSVVMVADIARTLNDFRPLGETLERICERVTGLSGYDATALFMPEPEGQRLVLQGSWGLRKAYIDYINRLHPILVDDTRQLGLAPAAEAYRSGHVVTLPDTELEPSFGPWKAGARLQSYRSLACIPVIVRSQAIGVLVCYHGEPRHHPREELELLQLVARLAGSAIETARVGEDQRRALEQLRALTERLRQQNEELNNLSAIQSRLVEELVDPDATILERTARSLAELTGRAILVSAPPGHPLVYVGRPEEREAMELIAGRRELTGQLRQQRVLRADGDTCLRIGLGEMPLGVIVLRPALEDESGTAALAAAHAAAVMAAELHSERADRALQMYARPAVLLALAHGLYRQAYFREAAGVLGIPADAEIRLALCRSSSSEAAYRLSRGLESIRSAGWPAVAATPDGRDTLVLLDPAEPGRLRRAARQLRVMHPEIERIGVSSTAPGLSALAAARDQARAAAGIEVGGAASATLFEDLGVFGELAGNLGPGRVEEWVGRVLGRLRAYDHAKGACLVDTLAAYVRHQGRIKQAAAELRVHPNTVHQRLRRAAELGGFDLQDFRDLGQLVVALEWDQMLRAQTASREDREGQLLRP